MVRAENRARLRRPDVTVVLLDASPAFLASRVASRPQRPLLNDAASPVDVLTRLHDERADLYAEVADVTVDVEPFHDTEEKPKRAMAERIAALVLAHEAKVSA